MNDTKLANDIADQLKTMVARKGAELYGGEAVTQKQHALQCAQLAENEGAPAALIAAALLHDVGHLFEHGFDEALASGKDWRHEELGERFLGAWFGPEVTEPVRLHVAAKRYLCAVEPAYREGLSAASEHSLMLQGGPMSPEEVAVFEEKPYFEHGVRLRRWDDRGKDPAMRTESFDHFLGYVRQCVKPANDV